MPKKPYCRRKSYKGVFDPMLLAGEDMLAHFCDSKPKNGIS